MIYTDRVTNLESRYVSIKLGCLVRFVYTYLFMDPDGNPTIVL
jgi:hypothetical protein